MVVSPAPARGSAFKRDRIISGAGVTLLHMGLGYALFHGFGVEPTRRPDRAIAAFDLVAPSPPAPEPSRPARRPEPEGRAAPPALRAEPKPVVAPPSLVPVPPPSLPAAPVAAEGREARSGAASMPGPGTGAGGVGDGLGGGGQGDGTGGGGPAIPARRVSGEIRNRDYPRPAVRARAEGDVIAHLSIDAAGRVSDCRVARSSGSADLDAVTCRLIRERFRYAPALDRQGRPVPDQVGWRQSWWFGR